MELTNFGLVQSLAPARADQGNESAQVAGHIDLAFSYRLDDSLIATSASCSGKAAWGIVCARSVHD